MKNSVILGIDPGQEKSAYLLWDKDNREILAMEIVDNEYLINPIISTLEYGVCGIETVVSYGMPVGKTTFETCFWLGEFRRRLKDINKKFYLIEKPNIRLHFCNSRRAKDSNINQALVDRFGKKGTKKNPGILYGVKTHIWSALAISVYLADECV